MFLKYDPETDSIRVVEEAWILPELQKVYKNDKTKTKVFFEDVKKYMFHVYSPDHMFSGRSFSQRKKIVIEKYLPQRKEEDFELNQSVKKLIEVYIDLCYTMNEQFYEEIKNNIDSQQKFIISLPLSKKIKIKRTIAVDIGDGQVKNIDIDFMTDIDMGQERIDAMKRAKQLLKDKEDIELMVIKERKEKKRQTTRRLFE